MKMIIGGAYQGKLAYAMERYPGLAWVDGKVCDLEEIDGCGGIYNFEVYMKRWLQTESKGERFPSDVVEEKARQLSEELIQRNPKVVIVCREIGCGLVPVDDFERGYREMAGRVCTRLARYADRVERMVCGIASVLKDTEVFSSLSGILYVGPEEIEKKSFEIISKELGDCPFAPGTEMIVKRCIHTSADFDYVQNLVFSEGVVERAKEAIKNGAVIVTDTQMAKAGINKKRLEKYGGEVLCFMSDDDVAKMAKEQKRTRAAVSMDKAQKLRGPLIFAVGNAPTALIRLYDLIQEEKLKPELIIGAPVGFVNVVQSKELILSLQDTPYIVARGRKGGSNIAACICNALLYMLD